MRWHAGQSRSHAHLCFVHQLSLITEANKDDDKVTCPHAHMLDMIKSPIIVRPHGTLTSDLGFLDNHFDLVHFVIPYFWLPIMAFIYRLVLASYIDRTNNNRVEMVNSVSLGIHFQYCQSFP